jgi:hypothetical protein
MKHSLWKLLIVATLTVCASGTHAQEWKSSKGKNYQDLDTASMWVSKHEFGLEFSCDANDGPKRQLKAKFLGPALPRLYGEDGDTAKLSFLFTLRGGVLIREAWEPYYFDGGLGDQAWLGPVRFGETELNALARAQKLDILNQDGELVYEFGTKGTSAAIAKLRQACRFAAAKQAAEQNTPAKNTAEKAPGLGSDVEDEVAHGSGPDCHTWELQTTFLTGGKICVTDSLPPHKSTTYGAANLVKEGAWCVEDKRGKFPAATFSYFGYGENRKSPGFSRLMVENGDTKSVEDFGKRARAKTVIVSSGNFYQEAFVLRDTEDLQYIDLGYEIAPDELQIEIVDTYAGSDRQNVCISTLSADFEYDPAFNSDDEILAKPLDLRDAFELKQLRKKSASTLPLDVPKPTDHMAREERPTPLTIEQFKVHAGWPEKIASYKISTPETMKFAIIDNGFFGAEEFVTNTPSLHGRVRHYRLGKKQKGKKSTNHGTNVLKVVNEVMPAGQIYLIDVSNTKGRAPELGVKKMNELGVHYGTMSLGTMGRYGRHNFDEKLPKFVRLLEETQTTLFVSAGNYRGIIHTADFSDNDQDGILELGPESAEVDDPEMLWIKTTKKGDGLLIFAWDIPENPTGKVSIFISDGDEFNFLKQFPVKKGTGRIRLKAPKNSKLSISIAVGGLSEPFGGIRVRKHGLRDAGPAWNGLRSSGDYAIWDSPFLIPVGSVGERHGHLAPSVFSSIDRSNMDKTMPLVLGPGQVIVGEETLNGTSFATPFIAALYATYGAQNISNVIEETSAFDAIGEGYVPAESGRWGIPVAEKLLGTNRCFEGKNQLNQMQIEDSELTIEYQFSRNCMEKIQYAVVMTLQTHGADPRTGYRGVVTNTIEGVEQPLQVLLRDMSETRDIVDKTMTFTADLSNISPRFKGMKVLPKFQIYTHMDRSGLILYSSDETVTLN